MERRGDAMIEKKDDVRAGSAAAGGDRHRGLQDRLTDAIVSGALAPGTRLDERDLAAALSAGAAEVLRALDGLAAVGLIAVRRDGTRWVTAFDGDRARDVVALFGDVWIGSVRRTMALLHADDLAYLDELVEDVALAVRGRDGSAFGGGLRALAVAFARIEGNAERAELVGSLGTLLACIARRAGSVFDWSDVRAAVARIAVVLPGRDAAAMRTALIALFDDVLPGIVDRAVAPARPLAAAS
ncbi:GntR family transcriptional regulator [Microbacterium paraoxydans]|uniref:GntR family transcriptional regulator n=1 Tax=Microbacterium paraoxydans TaxID=199592 RepID=UPI003013DFDA